MREHEENGLDGIFGMVPVTQNLPADAPDHRPMPVDQRGERHLASRIVAGDEPLQQLPVGQSGERAALEERLNLPDDRPRSPVPHARALPCSNLCLAIPHWIGASTPFMLSRLVSKIREIKRLLAEQHRVAQSKNRGTAKLT